MIPGSQALLISIFPHEKRATALGIWSITTLVAPICGPIFGGYISDSWNWGWIFLINVPVGLVVATFYSFPILVGLIEWWSGRQAFSARTATASVWLPTLPPSEATIGIRIASCTI